MKKVILVDGNNLLFRSYYATAYTGNIMRNSKGFPTNGLFGFVNMINKIINEDKPDYMLVAFDIGKTFRHEKYDNYKDGRSETPDELKMQFPVAKEILLAMGIKYLEVVGYEADDIIGTFSRLIDESDEYEGLIVSSDKDLLQLITDKVTVKLLKSKDYIMMDRNTFIDTYEIEPIRMIDLKGLMGDSSDNIPGVKGIGEKTAIKLLKEYGTIDNLYLHIDEVKGAVSNKLNSGRDSAFVSRELATIYREVPVDISFDDIKFECEITNELIDLYKELEFNNMIKKLDICTSSKDIDYKVIDNVLDIVVNEDISLYVDIDDDNYHKANMLGIALYNDKISCYIPSDKLSDLSFIKGNIYTYDNKKNYVVFRKNNISVSNVSMDVMIAAYLLNYNVKDDISVIANVMGYDISSYNKREVISNEERMLRCVKKAKFIYEVTNKLFCDMNDNGVMELYQNIELPLSNVLGRMEYEGIRCDSNV
jgi:DNA polymerase-1